MYTVLLKPTFLRKLASRIICRIIPEEIVVLGARIVLNPSDPIVSGNLALGCYETYNLELFRSWMRPGMRVVDVGANIGLYSAVAAAAVGSGGRVVAIEPDRENCSFVRATRERNAFSWMTVVEKAAGERCGRAQLYLCEDNRADHRVYDPGGSRRRVDIEMTTLDALLEELALDRVDFLKMDTQGSEHRVVAGMARVLRDNPGIGILMEFWPWGIRRSGGSPRELLDSLAGLGFSPHRVDGNHRSLVPLRDPASVLELDLERQHVDLYLVRR